MRRIALGLSLTLLASCASTVPPYSRIYAPIQAESEQTVFVTANEQLALVESALHSAGVPVAAHLTGATLLLRAKLGSPRGGGRCGAVRNVLFDLREHGERIAVIKGRGWVGPREVFDAPRGERPSRELPSRLRDQAAHRARRDGRLAPRDVAAGIEPVGEPRCAPSDESPNILRDMSQELARMISAPR